ncbi:hypothetical protein WICPIJ_001670 [Wickerhamomyces pijperi]|uniref:Mitochondrial import receptor subunit TOM70 n=1 Tax=Wickerhamomyces pijperi TaxID=599730 RepID=A0A9P8QB79_WICPI|nr:hypothetical protein WICPIJ_001670 [Wickerhamomyces pijperi]
MSEFIQKNKVAIIATVSTLGVAAGAYYLYQQQQQQQSTSSSSTSSETSGSKKKKKNSKKKSKDASGSGSASQSEKAPAATTVAANAYPTDSEGFPALTAEYIESLDAEAKEKVSLGLKEEGNTLFKDKDYHGAIKYYSAALEVVPSEVFYSNRSACYFGLEDYPKVVEDTTAALKIKPDYVKCLTRRSNAFEHLEKYEDAMFDLTAITLYGGVNNKSVEVTLDRILKKQALLKLNEKLQNNQLTLPSPTNITSFFGAFHEETEISYEHADDESHGDYFLKKALDQLDQKTYECYELADSYFNQAVAKYQASSEDSTNLAIAYEYSGIFKFLKADAASALYDIERAIGVHPRSRSYVFQALINADKQDVAAAEASFTKALEISPNSSEAYYHRAQLSYLTNNLDKAEADFKTSQELDQNNIYTYIQLACIEYRKQNHAACEALFHEAKTKFPLSAEIPNYYGEILADKTDFEGALKQFDIAAKLQDALLPKISVGVLPLINKATILGRNPEKILESVELLERAVDIDSKSELAKLTLAQLYLQLNKVEEAAKLFDDAADLSRNYEEKLQAVSFAEASKIQIRVKNDPVLSKRVNELIAGFGAQQFA